MCRPGRKTEVRPTGSEMLQALHNNGVRLVLIEGVERFARDLRIREAVIAQLQRGGFELVWVAESLSARRSDAEAGTLSVGRCGRIGEIHPHGEVAGRAGTQAGTDGPLRRSQALRLHSGRAAGYRVEERSMIARNGHHRIATALKDKGVPTSGRGRWHGWAVHQILTRQGKPNERVAERVESDRRKGASAKEGMFGGSSSRSRASASANRPRPRVGRLPTNASGGASESSSAPSRGASEERSERLRSVTEATRGYLKGYSVNHRPKSVQWSTERIAHIERLLGEVLLPDLTEARIRD